MTDRRIINEDTIADWFADHGVTCYKTQIAELEARRDEVIGDAGRYWQHCEFTRATLRLIAAEITELKQRAYDRYQDWKTDMLD